LQKPLTTLTLVELNPPTPLLSILSSLLNPLTLGLNPLTLFLSILSNPLLSILSIFLNSLTLPLTLWFKGFEINLVLLHW
jgi:hypothetical protein